MDERLSVIRKALWDMNFPPTYLGAHYLAYAELLVLQDQGRLALVTKWLYPEVAARYRTTWKAVERNIRTVITICWRQDGGGGLSRSLGMVVGEKPSPAQLIQLVAHYFLSQPENFWRESDGPVQLSLWQE